MSHSSIGSGLSAQRRELFEIILRKKGLEAAVPQAIAPRRFQGPTALSFAQQRLWFIDQLEGASAAYHLPAAVRLHGELDVASLQSALDTLVRRHEVLRTVFTAVDGEPMQMVVDIAGFALQRIDLSARPTAERETEVERQAREEIATAFDLRQGPVIRGRLLRLSGDEHVLLVTMHHIVADGWSMGVLIREVGALYSAYREGRSNPLSALPIQYADYAHWQRQWLQREAVQAQLDYWKKQLMDAPALLALPLDRPRPPTQSYRGVLVGLSLGKELTAAVKELTRSLDATLHMTLYAGFAIVLSRLSGQRDVVIGTPVANRQRTEVEGLIGFFVNTLALRVKVDLDASVGELVQHVKELTLSGYAHQEIPFEQVVEAVQAPRKLSHSPVFQVMFGLQNTPRSSLELPGLTLAPQGMPAQASQFDLSLSLQEADDNVTGTLNYASDLFERSTIERWIGYIKTVLREMTLDVRRKIGDLQLLSQAERQILRSFNATEVTHAPEALLHRLFEAQAARTPDEIAAICEDERLSYAQLNSRADQLAHYLRARGVGPNQRVASCVERGIDMVVGLLGILKAGGVYVPLDPAYPAERLKYMLEDAAPCLILTQKKLRGALPQTDAPIVALDGQWTQVAQQGNTNAICADLTPEHLAYVIYTSGSTGVPKGAAMSHGAFANLLEWQRSDASGDRPLRTAQYSAPSFDVSLQEIFSTLCTGGTLLPIHEAVRQDPIALVRKLRDANVQRLFLPFIALQSLAETVDAHGEPPPHGLQEVITAGEQLRITPAIARFFGRLPACRLHNHYGPTESHVVTTHTLQGEPSDWPELPPIGRPIHNVQIHVLDEHRQQVPIGTVGELHIGGAAVASGYLNRPALTAERFIRDPFSADPHARLYKTGDLGRWRPDGTLEYVGRNDHQVKIRGYRIELGEIEVQLSRHARVREAAVSVREDRPGEKRLVAYLSAHAPVPTAETLRIYLGERLPQYMIPSAFVVLDSLPLTSSGKVDRRALPAPELDAYATREYQQPQGEIETSLAQIWQELLQIERVGRHDNFFDLGGHSLLAVQLLARINQRLGHEVSLREIFEFQTLQAFAQQLGTTAKAMQALIEPADRGASLPLSLSQQRLWFIDQLEGAGAAYHLPAAVRLQGELDVDALQSALDTLLQRHEVLRTVFIETHGEPSLQISGEGQFALLKIDLSELDREARESELRRHAREEAAGRFDLGRGPLIRGRLLKVSEREHALLVTMHHIVSDGWSMGILTREISALYAAYREGLDNPLPRLPIQYVDYAQWQRRWLAGEVLQEQLNYWKARLADAPALLELPADRPRPAVQSYRGGSVSVRLGTQLSSDLKRVARRFDATMHMTLYAGFAILLSRLSGQRDLVIGTPVANRRRTELEGLIGFFVNTLALRVKVDAGASIAGLLTQVKDLTLGDYARQDVPFEQVVETIQPRRSLSHGPIFQVLFAFQNTPQSALLLPGLTLASLGTGTHTAQFDLSLSLEETDGEIVGALNYASDLFDRSTIERWVGHFKTVLREMTQDANRTVGELRLLSEPERQQLLKEFNATQAAHPQDVLIHELFEAQVEQVPDATAAICKNERLSYAQLNRRANQLAHHLTDLGVTPDQCVAICVERGLEMIVGLLGILKAGGAYVPLDPAYPDERLQYMLNDAVPCVVLTQERLKDRLASTSARLVCIDTDWQQIEQHKDINPVPAALGIHSRHLAYVLYTSGSTGVPKGVLIEHRNAANLIHWGRSQFSSAQLRHVLLSTSINFDLSVFELFVPLASGGCVQLVDSALDMGSPDGVTLINTVPSAIQVLLDQGGIASSTTTINLAGEALKSELVEALFAATQAQSIFNLYGPTETTTYSTHARIDRMGDRHIHIGRPIANTQVYILDEQLQPVPIGVTGEIYIGGAGVARGYLHRPELTRQRFLPDLFSDDPQGRIYRTGDLGRWRADGHLDYLGRNDHQVKVRGYRIELGEIEDRLNRHPLIQAAVVIAHEDAVGQKRLIAYVTAGGDAPAAEVLRSYLGAHLPQYMIPSAFVLLESMPLTPNGKVDRKSLPAPDLDAYATRQYEAPRGEIEFALADLWQQLLQIERVGRNDDFFELGGHSLLAVQLLARVRQGLGRELTLREVFECSLLRDMAKRVSASGLVDSAPIERANRDVALLPSLAQQRLWFIDRLEGTGAAYHLPVAVRLRGELDVAALRATLDTLVLRHEVLRTVFAEVDGQPVLDIAATGNFDLQVIDLTELGVREREASVRRYARDEVRQPFDLAHGPLIRGRLLQLQDREYVLLVTMHHIVADGWSIGVLVREVAALYTAYRNGLGNPLPALPLQYADYAQWQRQWLVDDVLQAHLAYWKDRLAGSPALLELPTDRARPAIQSYRGESVIMRLDRTLSGEIRKLARRFDATLYMALYAGFAVLLARLSGQNDIVIGVPAANRQRKEVEGLIGFFVNTLALRIQVDASASVAELLQAVKDMTLDGYAHQEVPFEQVVQALQPPRSLSHSPVFQVLFTFHNTPGSALELPGLALASEGIPTQAAQFDLSLSLQEAGEEIVGACNYASDLFDRSTIERWIEHFKIVLVEMTGDAQRKVGALQVLSESGRRQVLELFNATQAPYPRESLVHELFESQVQRTPDAVALIHEDGQLSYAELNARANQLACHLRMQGVGPDRLVALCMTRGVEMMIGVLGILKAGGAYVPLDPEYPSQRLHDMLNDAAPGVLLTQERLKASLPPTSAMVIAIDAEWPRIAQHGSSNVVHAGLTSRNLAYVIYTSGSTGTPKGVAVEHRNVAHLWAGLEQAIYSRHPRCRRVSVNASMSFDASVQQWVQLLSGRTLIVVPAEVRRDAAELLGFVRNARLDGLDCTPAQLAAMSHAGLFETEQSLHVVLVGGEAIDTDVWNDLGLCRSISFYNVYGPAECTVDSSVGQADDSGVAPHIGRPLSNAQIYLLDEHLEPVPIGVTGEIYIGGAGVARGYLHRPELTAQRFLTDPFSTDPQARIYKSGDLGRWRADGTIEYLGRNDHQVKVRGYRIELGEIEAQLRRAESVTDAVVIAREDVSGQKRLIAYVTSIDSGFSAEAMRTHLSERLPPYMLPSAFVRLDTLPLTPNGKVDHKALPAPELDAYATREYEAPQGEIEVAIAEIWQSLLQVERIGRHDHFFELGGHSLLIVQLIERLRHYSLQAEVRSVFDAPTVAGLASRVSREGTQAFQAPPNRIPPDCEQITPAMLPLIELTEAEIEQVVAQVPGGAKNIQDLYPLAPLQEGILFHHLLTEANNTGDTYVLPMLLQVADRLHVEKLIDALQALIDRHDILRTAVLWEGLPRAVQVVYRRAPLPVEELVLSGEAPVLTQMQQRMTPGQQHLELRRAPLMQLKLAYDGEQDRWYVLLQLHHLTSDHVALELVVSEVDAHLQGRGSQLSEPLPYRHYVAQALARAQRNDAETFFRGKLGSVEEPTAPFGLIDVHGDGSEVLHVHERLDAALARQVRALARRLGMSPASLFHAAFGLVVARTSAREDIVFGSVLSGRLQGTAGADRMLGMFINTLPLRLQLQGMTALQWVQQTHRELVALLEHEQASLAMAQRCSGIGGGAPLFSSIFNYRHSAAPSTAEPSHKSQGIGVIAVQERTNYPLSVSVDDLGEGFGVTVQADQRIDAQRMSRYLCTALAGLMQALESAPAAQALHLPVLPEAERRQVLEEFNATQVPYPQSALIHELFEAQVERTPTAIAVVYEGERLNYAQLNARANQLARYLLTYGITPDQRVAICVERGLEMIMGLLGILKAGGAYVPLDPKYPAERLQYMLSDASPCLVLTQQHLKDVLPTTTAPVITLDSDWPQIAQHSEANVPAAALALTAKHLAYVIYTSGSTGLPKGVAAEHAGMVNRILAQEAIAPFLATDICCHKTSIGFVDAIFEALGPLAHGRPLVIAPAATVNDIEQLAILVLRERVTRWITVPSLAQALVENPRMAHYLANLRNWTLSGEELKAELLEKLQRQLPACEFVNLYGSSEVAADATWYSSTEFRGGRVPIGRPIANTQIYILDSGHQPLPIGVTGEIHVAGAGLAREYLNQPELTRARFRRNPFSPDPAARMYGSGDLGRWRPDGTIEYAGRNDHQVKLRGYRIELGEIEARLMRHPRVKEAVVVARNDGDDTKRLIAYVTYREEAPSTEELRAHLQTVLPEYMVPAAFVSMESLPRTPTGKLNRQALPAPTDDAYSLQLYEPPRGAVETGVASIWRELLHVEEIGRLDNFFELGGDSILAMRVIARVYRTFEAELRLDMIFECPTVAQLAECIEAMLWMKQPLSDSAGLPEAHESGEL